MSASVKGFPLSVLLVEDNPDDAFLIERHLGRHGFDVTMRRVEVASDLRAALQQEPLPDVLLADFHLPNFSGPEALQVLKESGHDIPFIMLSGAVSEETAVSSMRAGAQDYVSKENLARLCPAIERELKEAQGRQTKRETEHALRTSEIRFHRLVEGMPLGLLIGDSTGRISYANAAILSLLDLTEDALLSGKETVQSICPALMEAYLDPAKFSAPFEAVCFDATGKAIDVLIGIAKLTSETHPENQEIAAFIANMTMQKQSQLALQQAEKLAVAGRFAASIAHEINNPLEAVTNCLYLASTTDLPHDSREYIELAQKELDRVAQITVQTLRFFRGYNAKDRVDVHDLIGSVLSLFEARLQRARIGIGRQFRARTFVLSEAGEIRQVVANLVSNAMDALSAGGQITIRTADASHPVDGVRGLAITVADNGSGIAQHLMEKIFEPFFSTKGATGTGLGLWISREILSKHKGSIRVRSRVATGDGMHGTVFRIFVPDGQKDAETQSASDTQDK